MLSEDTKAIVASNLTVAISILVTSGWGEADKERKHPDPRMMISAWFEEFLDSLGENE